MREELGKLGLQKLVSKKDTLMRAYAYVLHHSVLSSNITNVYGLYRLAGRLRDQCRNISTAALSISNADQSPSRVDLRKFVREGLRTSEGIRAVRMRRDIGRQDSSSTRCNVTRIDGCNL